MIYCGSPIQNVPVLIAITTTTHGLAMQAAYFSEVIGVKDLASFAIRAFRKMSVRILAAVMVLGLALFCMAAFAQSGAGAIQGTVTDSTNAVISGARVHVVNQATTEATDTKSNSVGYYQVPELFTGTYSVTVTAPGMKTYTTSIELQVAQNAVINPVLTAGEVTQQITVNANTVQLTTVDSGALTSTLENDRISQLPMDGRNILTLVGESSPGMEDNGQKMDGQAIEALEYVIDGSSTANNLYGGQNVNDNGQSTSTRAMRSARQRS